MQAGVAAAAGYSGRTSPPPSRPGRASFAPACHRRSNPERLLTDAEPARGLAFDENDFAICSGVETAAGIWRCPRAALDGAIAGSAQLFGANGDCCCRARRTAGARLPSEPADSAPVRRRLRRTYCTPAPAVPMFFSTFALRALTLLISQYCFGSGSRAFLTNSQTSVSVHRQSRRPHPGTRQPFTQPLRAGAGRRIRPERVLAVLFYP